MRPPRIFKDPYDEPFVVEGNNVTFYVKVKGVELTFQWLKDSMEIFNDPGVYNGTDTDTLTILNVNLSDVGEYSVRVSNGAGSEVSIPAILLTSMTIPT